LLAAGNRPIEVVYGDGPLPQLYWRAIDRVDYWPMQARLWLVDACGAPFPTGDTPD